MRKVLKWYFWYRLLIWAVGFMVVRATQKKALLAWTMDASSDSWEVAPDLIMQVWLSGEQEGLRSLKDSRGNAVSFRLAQEVGFNAIAIPALNQILVGSALYAEFITRRDGYRMLMGVLLHEQRHLHQTWLFSSQFTPFKWICELDADWAARRAGYGPDFAEAIQIIQKHNALTWKALVHPTHPPTKLRVRLSDTGNTLRGRKYQKAFAREVQVGNKVIFGDLDPVIIDDVYKLPAEDYYVFRSRRDITDAPGEEEVFILR